MGDEGANYVRMRRDERQHVHRATAARQDIDRAGTHGGLDNPVDVVGMCLRGGIRIGGESAALALPRVVGDHGAVGEVVGQGREPGGGHRRSDHQQWGLVRVAAGADVIGQDGAGCVDRMGRGFGHLGLLRPDRFHAAPGTLARSRRTVGGWWLVRSAYHAEREVTTAAGAIAEAAALACSACSWWRKQNVLIASMALSVHVDLGSPLV